MGDHRVYQVVDGLMYEDELPEDFPFYDWWFDESYVDGVRIGPKIVDITETILGGQMGNLGILRDQIIEADEVYAADPTKENWATLCCLLELATVRIRALREDVSRPILESVLAKDWNTPQEDEAWKDL